MMASLARLHEFSRSTASYRVRIALNLKGIPYESVEYKLREGQQREAEYLRINPQGLVPALEIDGATLTQSLSICEYLDETRTSPPLLPPGTEDRAKIRAFAQVIACDIHPVQNLKILQRLGSFGLEPSAVTTWAATTIEEGLDTCNSLLPAKEQEFCFGAQPSLADICLVPQLLNARRFGVDLRWPRLLAVEAACLRRDAFVRASPDEGGREGTPQ
ncbi:maleylacetoacetate isomerase [Novosphingobium kaempferiae]|uniref:maleylacetoacetate isomerase n=1 Tax=Novosphingobium kaempferiae TaxID=2896849 RepID=UPI001E546CBF|nr:maleylacetoacetate isomerase [Novosphingobium kaempferiae]